MTKMKIQTNLRIEPQLRDQLQKAADASGSSVTREITERLEKSFSAPQHHDEALDSPEANAIGAVLLEAIYAAGHNAGGLSTSSAGGSKTWHNNPYAYDQVCKAVATVMDRLRPPGAVKLPIKSPNDAPEMFEHIGARVADGILLEIADVDDPSAPASPYDDTARARHLKELLGPLGERLKNHEASNHSKEG
ncbi:hypothetical protein V1281_001781 [Nitrobacteraceae bacterium AZCC 2161]